MAKRSVGQVSVSGAANGEGARMVMAIGDSGAYEAMPAREVVEVGSVPVGEDNIIIPASIRYLRRDPTEGNPVRLLSIRRPSTRLNRRSFLLVTFKCTPYARYTWKGKPVLGDVKSCFITNERDARDPLFESLTVRERFRIVSAFRHHSDGAPT